MAHVQTIKLEINIPISGTVKYLDYYPEKPSTNKPGTMMPAQWGLKGEFDGIGEARFYVDEYQLATNLFTAGFAEKAGERGGIPQFRWTHQGPVQIVKREDGRKRIVSISSVAPVTNAAPVATHRGMPNASNDEPVSGSEWDNLKETYDESAKIAAAIWGEQFDPAALVAATATIFIEANKRGLRAAP